MELHNMQAPHFHLLTVKYLGPTNSRGSRVKISSDRFEDSKTIGCDHKFNSSMAQAVEWCAKNGFNVVGTAEGKGPLSYIVTDQFRGVTEVPDYLKQLTDKTSALDYPEIHESGV